jgi:hypothetical protein
LIRELVGTDPSREITLAVAAGIRDTYLARFRRVRNNTQTILK